MVNLSPRAGAQKQSSILQKIWGSQKYYVPAGSSVVPPLKVNRGTDRDSLEGGS